MPNAKRSYRKHYVTSWGETIVGLTKSTDGRFRPVGHSSPAWSGRDEAKAIHKFRLWQGSQQENGEPLDDDDYGIHHGPTLEGKAYWSRYFHELLVRDPRQAAIELDDERLTRLNELGAREPSLPLAEMGESYRNKKPPLSPDWRRKAKLFWDEFCGITRAETVRDVTPDDLAQYGDEIHGREMSPTYAGHRFGLVKYVLNHALKRGKDTDQLQRVLTLCKMLETPRKNGTDPQPISPEHFNALLDAAPLKWKAVLLLSLNAALYPSEVAAVESKHVNLDKRTLVMDRGKTGIPRVAVLWQRTVDAIRAYQAEARHQSSHLVVGRTGQPYDGNHVGRNFRRIRKEASVPDEIEFAHIRDGAYSAAFNADGVEEKHAKVLAGHRSGMSDAYVKRNPRCVAVACRAIEQSFFGDRLSS